MLTDRGPFNGPLYVQIGSDARIVSSDLARSVYVEPAEPLTKVRARKTGKDKTMGMGKNV